VERYLHKRDPHYNRIVPDWELQYRTAEQQYLYEGEFAVFVREITEEGAVVQDAVTGLVGFAPEQDYGDTQPMIGALLSGARCTYMDNTVVTSVDVNILRLQTGVVFEWNKAAGEGYIIPTEGQAAWRMLRVLRRDIDWHDSRQLFVGQFVQFETALHDEVPIEPNDEPLAPFALRVRSPEVRFSLRGVGEIAPGVPSTKGLPLPPASGRPAAGVKAHPVLQRWCSASGPEGYAESPSWLWGPPLAAAAQASRDPIVPLQLQPLPARRRKTTIMTHEVAAERGDLWRESAMIRGEKYYRQLKPPNMQEQEAMSEAAEQRRVRDARREKRRHALRIAAVDRGT